MSNEKLYVCKCGNEAMANQHRQPGKCKSCGQYHDWKLVAYDHNGRKIRG